MEEGFQLQVLQDQQDQNQDQELLTLQSDLDQVKVQDEVEVKGQTECLTEGNMEAQDSNHDPPESKLSPLDQHQDQDLEQDVRGAEQIQDQDQDQDHQTPDVNRASPAEGHCESDHDRDWDQTAAAANQDRALESGVGVPALVITEAEESHPEPARSLVSPSEPELGPGPQRPSDLVLPASPGSVFLHRSVSSSSDGGDMTCSDLLSLTSDSFSVVTERSVSRRSEDDDTRSVTASSVTTALHWAAKRGCQEAVDMMLCSGADVNVRSGYTALHLAAIHGHRHVVHALVNTYHAKTNLRDYHGKTALHYWSGCSDVFNRPDAPSDVRFSRGRRTQRCALPSLLLNRSRSQTQLNLEFTTAPQEAMDLQL